MPLQLMVHGPHCNWQTEECSCTPETFTDPRVASAAHGGQFWRLQLGALVPPPLHLPDPVPEWRSQKRRHTREISR